MSAYLEVIPLLWLEEDLPGYCAARAADMRRRLTEAGFTVVDVTAEVKEGATIADCGYTGDVIFTRGEIAEDVDLMTPRPSVGRPRGRL